MILWLIFSIVYGKKIKSHILLTEKDPWQSITSFGLDIGTGNYTFSARLATPLHNQEDIKEIQLGLYLGVDWTEDLLKKTCEDRVKKAKKLINVKLSGNTDWTSPIEGKLTQKHRPHVWYFVLSDCSGTLGYKKVRFELEIMNPNLSHFSVEMQGIKTIYGLLIIFLLMGLGKNLYTLFKFCKFDNEVQIPVIWVNFSIFFQVLGIFFLYFHLYVYEYDGEGIGVFEFFGEAFMLVSNLSITTLLIIIAGGWNLTYSEFPVPELYIPAIFLLTFLHLFMAGLDFITENEKFSFTRYEGISGFIIIIMRVLMYAWFLYNLRETSKHKDFKKSNFLYRFGLGASLYFLSIPLLVTGSTVFSPHSREKVMVAGINMTQAAAFYILSKIFTEKGDYYKINTVLNILPGSRSHTY